MASMRMTHQTYFPELSAGLGLIMTERSAELNGTCALVCRMNNHTSNPIFVLARDNGPLQFGSMKSTRKTGAL